MKSASEPWDAKRGAEIIAEHEGLEGATLVILHALQEAFGYVPEAAIPMVATALNQSRAEVYGVFTFYHDFRKQPAGMCGTSAAPKPARPRAAMRSPRARKTSSALPSATPRPMSA